MTGTSTPPPRFVHLSAHMRSSLNVGRVESVKSPEGGDLLQWESRCTRYIRAVGETLSPVSAPCFTSLKTFGGSKSLDAQGELAKRHFVAWIGYVYDLVVASWAFRVDLDSQVKNNLYFVRTQWEAGARRFVRGYVDIGLASQIPALRSALDVADDVMRFDAVTLSSSVLEELVPGMLSESTEGLAVAMRASANTFLLNGGMSPFRHAAAILALQRSLRSLPQESDIETRHELLGHYISHLHGDDTLGNAALLRSIDGLLRTFDCHVSKDEITLLNQLKSVLQRFVRQTESVAVGAMVETVIEKIPHVGKRKTLPSDTYAVKSHRAGDVDI